ncbi:hypothetical protein MMC07_001348 [Pseudocyphellaria aurata]|nr:hypothetical protein [Pseudocyphellaria aurata]
MPATVHYKPNSGEEPVLQKNNQIHKSGFHLHPHSPARRILSKKVLPGGSILFLLGTLSSLYDELSSDVIEVSAEVIGDYVAWEDLQAFEHDEFEKELAEKANNKKDYEMPELTQMMGATVKRARGRPKKNKDNFLGTVTQPRKKSTNNLDGLDTKSSKSQSSSTESHNGIIKRVRGRPKKSKQSPIPVIPQVQPQKVAHQPLDQFRQEDDNNGQRDDGSQPRLRRFRTPSRRILFPSDDEDKIDGKNDNTPPQPQIRRKPRPTRKFFHDSDVDDEDDDHDDNDEKDPSKAEHYPRTFQKDPSKPLPSYQAPPIHKFAVPPSIKPLNPTPSSHRLPTHTRPVPGPLMERASSSKRPTNTARTPPSLLKQTLLSPSQSRSMTTPFPGLQPRLGK